MKEIINEHSKTPCADPIGKIDPIDGQIDGRDQHAVGAAPGASASSSRGRTKDHAAFLVPLIGQPWSWQSRNCWDFACHVQKELFGRMLPSVSVPDDPKWKWMIAEIAGHPERGRWNVIEDGPHGLIRAADGALCLMGRNSGPGHIGVWLQPEAKIIHCDHKNGVCFEDVLALRQQGWVKMTFFEPQV